MVKDAGKRVVFVEIDYSNPKEHLYRDALNKVVLTMEAQGLELAATAPAVISATHGLYLLFRKSQAAKKG